MSSITTKESKLFVSVADAGPLEAAHLKEVLDAIDTPAVIVPSTRMLAMLKQLQAASVLGKGDVDLLKTALDAAAAGTPIANNDATATKTRAAVRKLKAILPASTVEGLVTLIFT